MKRAKGTDVKTRPSVLRRWILAGTIATTAVGTALLLTFARLQAGKAVWTEGFYLSGDQWFDAARTTVTLVGIIGLGGAAFLAYRKQVSTEASHLLEQSTSLRNRYTTAAEQLGHDSAAIRLAGVYALASLADDWLEFGKGKETQVCVDLLCAYLRTERPSSVAEPPRAAPSGSRILAGRRQRHLVPTAREKRVDHEEGNVRSAVVGVIRTGARSWRGGEGDQVRFGDGVHDLEGGLHLDLKGADLSRASLDDADLSRALMSRTNLSGALLDRADLTWATLLGADLSGANLNHVNLTHACLNGATLSGADLTRATLCRADLVGADLVGASLFDADLSRANLLGADLSRAGLIGANLSGADLSRAILAGANLSGARLDGARLDGVRLGGVDLAGVDLSRVDLSRVDLAGATHSIETKWPEGFVLPEPAGS